MAHGELELRVHLWRQKDVSGIFLCYRISGMAPVALHPGGSKLFPTEDAIDQALLDAHIASSLIGADERAATVFGLGLWQLERLGLEPQKAKN